MTSHIIKTKEAWASYKKRLLNRIDMAPHSLLMSEPNKYPFLVVSQIVPKGGLFSIENMFFYPEDVTELCKQK